MADFFSSIIEWFNNTQLTEQIKDVDAKGLFQNAYFLVPFISLIIYYLYKQAINNLIIMFLCLGVWYLSGSEYVATAVIDGELQMAKILPLAGAGIAIVAVLIYLLFIRND